MREELFSRIYFFAQSLLHTAPLAVNDILCTVKLLTTWREMSFKVNADARYVLWNDDKGARQAAPSFSSFLFDWEPLSLSCIYLKTQSSGKPEYFKFNQR